MTCLHGSTVTTQPHVLPLPKEESENSIQGHMYHWSRCIWLCETGLSSPHRHWEDIKAVDNIKKQHWFIVPEMVTLEILPHPNIITSSRL